MLDFFLSTDKANGYGKHQGGTQGGGVYTRWGSKTCPNTAAIVYQGQMAGEHVCYSKKTKILTHTFFPIRNLNNRQREKFRSRFFPFCLSTNEIQNFCFFCSIPIKVEEQIIFVYQLIKKDQIMIHVLVQQIRLQYHFYMVQNMKLIKFLVMLIVMIMKLLVLFVKLKMKEIKWAQIQTIQTN